MDKIKNLLNPGHKKDDDVMYGSGDQTSNVTSQDAPTSGGLSDRVTGAQHSSAGDPSVAGVSGNTGSSSTYPQSTGTGTGTGNAPYGSTSQSSTNPTSSTGDRSHLGGNTTRSGALGTAENEIERHSTHNTNQPTTTTGSGYHSGPTGTSVSQPGQSTTGSNIGSGSGHSGNQSHLGRDATAAGAIGTGAYEAEKHHHNKHNPTSGTSSSGTGVASDPKEVTDHYRHHATDGSEIPRGQLPGDLGEYDPRRGNHPSTQTAAPGTTGSRGTAHPTSGSNDNTTTAGPHSSNLANKADPRVDSDLSRQQHGSGGNSHLGRDAAAVGGAGLAAREAEHHHHGNNHGSTTGGLSGTNSRDYPTSNTTAGPHSSNTANRADPRVDSDLSRQQHGSGGNSHLGRDAAALGGAGLAAREAEKHHHGSNTGVGSGSQNPYSSTSGTQSNLGRGVRTETDPFHHNVLGSHQHGGHGHTYSGDPCPPGQEPTHQAGFTHGPHAVDTANRLDPHIPGEFPGESGYDRHQHGTTAGPHSSNLANKADPRVDSDLSRQQHPGGHSNVGRDAAALGGAGALGAGAYEAERHHHSHNNRDPLTSGTATSGTTAGPHSSNVANRADPRVDSDLSRQSGTSSAIPHHSGSHPSTGYADQRAEAPGQHQHHYGRDATALGGAGALGAGAYEAERRHNQDHPSGLTGGTSTGPTSGLTGSSTGTTAGPHSSNLANKSDPRVDSDLSRSQQPQHHYGRDAAAVGGVGAAGAGAYELANHGRAGPKDTDPASRTIGPHSSNVANIVDPRVQPDPAKQKDVTPAHNNETLNKLDPRVDSQNVPTQRHYGRDAAAVGGAGALGAGAYEAERHHRDQPATGTTAGSASDPYTHPRSSNVGQTGQQTTDPTSHKGRDAALVGGGAAAAGAGGYEYSKHEAEKEHQKELKELEKQHEKEHKHELKQHEKDAKAAEKQHEKDIKAAEKHHDKDEKKSGGLLGFLHKDKKHDDPAHEDADSKKHKHEAEAAAAGTGLAGAGVAEHEHNKNRDTSTLGSSTDPSTTSHPSSTTGSSQYAPGEHIRGVPGSYGSQTTTADPDLHAGHHHNKLHKEPPESVRRELEEKAAHQQGTTGNSGIVTDSRTGLPMNVGQYGSGVGGTDGSSTVHGYQGGSSSQY